ncbi:hypothetical protein ACFLT9_01890 [Acidobacteriota bacterium]
MKVPTLILGLFAAILAVKNPLGTLQNRNLRLRKLHDEEIEVFYKYGSEFAGITPKQKGADNGRI